MNSSSDFTQRPATGVGYGPNVSQQFAVAGQPVAAQNANGTGTDIARAGLFSTAPYNPPKPKRHVCQGKPGCKGPLVKTLVEQGKFFCTGHARSLGLIASWDKEDDGRPSAS